MKQFKHMQFLKDLSDIVGGFKITPMTDEEIDSLELRWHTKLPLAYREVFKIEGKTNAFGLRRNEYSIEEFDEMQEEVRDIIRRNDLHIDMDKIFAFSCFASLGNFCFYRLDEGENPPVYIYIGGQENYKKSYETFTDFIKSEDWYIAISLLYNSKDKEQKARCDKNQGLSKSLQAMVEKYTNMQKIEISDDIPEAIDGPKIFGPEVMNTNQTTVFMRRAFHRLLAGILVLLGLGAAAQMPVQVTPQLLPPYTLQVSEYYGGMQPKMQVLLLNRDVNQPNIQVKLRMTVESQNCRLRTKESAVTPTFTLTSGIPYYLSPQEL